MGQYLGVPRIRCLTAKDDRPAVAPTQDLVEESQLDLAVAGPTQMGPEMGSPQTPLADTVLERRDELLTDRVLHVPRMADNKVEGLDFLPNECLDPIKFLLEV